MCDLKQGLGRSRSAIGMGQGEAAWGRPPAQVDNTLRQVCKQRSTQGSGLRTAQLRLHGQVQPHAKGLGARNAIGMRQGGPVCGRLPAKLQQHTTMTQLLGTVRRRSTHGKGLRNNVATAQAVTTSKGLGCSPMPYSIGIRQGGAAWSRLPAQWIKHCYTRGSGERKDYLISCDAHNLESSEEKHSMHHTHSHERPRCLGHVGSCTSRPQAEGRLRQRY